jgi:hypothetical protein
MTLKKAFCAVEQKEIDHELKIEGAANDITLVCTDCGHFIKVPQGTTKDTLESFLVEHELLNTRDLSLQVPIMTEEEKQAELSNLV